MARREHVVLAAVVVLAAGLGYAAVRAAGPVPVPGKDQEPGKALDLGADLTVGGSTAHHLCQPSAHLSGTVVTPLRYPHVAGQEITALVHHGYGPMRLPSRRDLAWMARPPAEVTL